MIAEVPMLILATWMSWPGLFDMNDGFLTTSAGWGACPGALTADRVMMLDLTIPPVGTAVAVVEAWPGFAVKGLSD